MVPDGDEDEGGKNEMEWTQNVDTELKGIWHDLGEMEGEIEEDTTLTDYVMADDKVYTDGIMTLEEIATSTSTTPNDSNGEDEEVEIELPAVSNVEARQALEILCRYIKQNVEDPAVLRMCDKLDDATARKRMKAMQQTKLTDYLHK